MAGGPDICSLHQWVGAKPAGPSLMANKPIYLSAATASIHYLYSLVRIRSVLMLVTENVENVYLPSFRSGNGVNLSVK